jgi:predicted amidohydrolase YtcJ
MKNLLKVVSLLLTCIIILTGCGSDDSKYADLVILNGKIVTIDDSNPRVDALAVNADTIMALGTVEEINSLVNDETKVIDAAGKFVMPGFIDSHAHFLSIGKARMELDLKSANNWDEIVAMVADEASKLKPGDWIKGRGWHQEKWNPIPRPNVEGYPLHTMLSQAVPFNPVLLTHASGHAIFANAKAMEIAGVDSSTKDPEGGKIVKDEEGNPIGVFEENAAGLISRYYNDYLQKLSEEELKLNQVRAYMLASEECLSKGITTLHDAGASYADIDIMMELADSNKLGVRIYVMLDEDYDDLKMSMLAYRIIGYGKNHVTVRSIKKYIDGALGSRGAWLLEPYIDLPEHTGQNVMTLKELRKVAELAIENDFQLCVHAIGDRGNREVLNIYEKIFQDNPDKEDTRWRIEHAQHLSGEDIGRFAELKVIAAMQGIHCTSDAIFVLRRLGRERGEEGAYVWRKLTDSGALICNGTDAPVEDVDPIPCFYASVTRRLDDGTAFFPDQSMTRMEALKSYTINGAYAGFEEDIKGSLEVGKLADIVVLSQDLLTVNDDDIRRTKVEKTIVGGKILYSQN